jgi:hypothetical protein
MVPTLSHQNFAILIEALQHDLSAAQYTLIVCCIDVSAELRLLQARKLVERGVECLVLFGENQPDALFDLLKSQNVPYVITYTSGRDGSVSTRAKPDFCTILLRLLSPRQQKANILYFRASLKLLVTISLARVLTEPRSAGKVEEVPVDHPGLSQGWWAAEQDGQALHRWTNGDAVLSLPPSHGPMMLEIRASNGGMTYVIGAKATIESEIDRKVA